jgi:uncharacterized LabA/DUF88 family protein
MPAICRLCKTNVISYELFADILTREEDLFPKNVSFELIRTYYYDAQISEKEDRKKYREINKNMERVEYIPGFDVRLGTLKKTKDGYRQKGVDTLIAIDMLSKAYENHYDMAVLVAGDEDFLEVVKSVKNTGKRVIGVFFRSHISENLMNSFDRCFIINKEWIQRFAMYTVKNSKTIEDFLVSMLIDAKQNILVSTYLIDPFSYFNKTNFLPIFINAGNNYISIKILLNKKTRNCTHYCPRR